ncbi:MAG: hypothetical protein RIQ94_1568, partial [Pseudomonadota bacterium]
TLNSKERQNNYLCELSRLHPRPKGRGFTLHMDKIAVSLYKSQAKNDQL